MPIPSDDSDLRIMLAIGDAAALIQWSKLQDTQPCTHEYPRCHRIADFVSGDRAIRVIRCVSCDERIFIKEIGPEIANPSAAGVPYELKGAKLQKWIASETREPTKGPVNWNDYL